MAENGREVATRHRSDGSIADHDGAVGAWWATSVGGDTPQDAVDPSLLLGGQGGATTKVAFVPRHDPFESGLQAGDSGPEFVAVQRQAGFEAKSVAGAETGGRDVGADDRSPECAGRVARDGDLDTGFAGVAGTRHHALDTIPRERLHVETLDGCCFREDGRQFGAGIRTLNRQDGSRRCDVGATDGFDHA